MRYSLFLLCGLAALPLCAQRLAGPNGRYYPNLPHGTLDRDLSASNGAPFTLYHPPGNDSVRLLFIFPAGEALDSTGTTYAPWMLDNLQAQEALPAVAAVFLHDTDLDDRVVLAETRELLPRLSASAEVHRMDSEMDADLSGQLRADTAAGFSARVRAGVYPPPHPGEDPTLFSGPTAHFGDLTLERWDPAVPAPLSEANREQMIIVREGTLSVDLRDTAYQLGPRSVLFLTAGDSAVVGAAASGTTTYRMSYADPVGGISTGAGSSFVILYDSLSFRSHDKGGLRNYFRTATPYCPYYEMHMTTLNPDLKSHEPHVHAAAEVIILLEGTTEMEIGNERVRATAGDIYYLPSQVPHAIRNLGETPCTYFAFQWDN